VIIARKRLGTLKHAAAQHNNDVIVVVPPLSMKKGKTNAGANNTLSASMNAYLNNCSQMSKQVQSSWI